MTTTPAIAPVASIINALGSGTDWTWKEGPKSRVQVRAKGRVQGTE